MFPIHAANVQGPRRMISLSTAKSSDVIGPVAVLCPAMHYAMAYGVQNLIGKSALQPIQQCFQCSVVIR